jgi:hypothetical protein
MQEKKFKKHKQKLKLPNAFQGNKSRKTTNLNIVEVDCCTVWTYYVRLVDAKLQSLLLFRPSPSTAFLALQNR